MANIGWIKLGLTTDISGLKKGLGSASEQLQKLRENVMHAIEAFAVFEIAKKAFETIKGSIEAVSQTKILAERVGMSAEAFGKLSAAAKLAHMDQEGLATSLEQLSKRLGEVAVEGEGPAANALKRFRLEAGKLAQLGTAGAFQKIVQVMEGIKNPAERSAVAMDLFGRSGMAMINLVAMGGEELKKAGDEAGRLGYALDNVSVAKMEEADQAFMKLEMAATGFMNLLVVQLAPVITMIIEKYMEWGYSGTKSADWIRAGIDSVISGMGLVVDAINVVKTAEIALTHVGVMLWSDMLLGIGKAIEAWNWFLEKVAQAREAYAWLVGDSEAQQKAEGDAIRNSALSQGSKNLENYFKSWSEEANKFGDALADEMGKTFAKIGQGGDMLRGMWGKFSMEATLKASAAAGKSAGFITPGKLSRQKIEPTKFAGAADLGSKEAYSAILKSRGMYEKDKDSAKIARHTERTAEAAERSVSYLETIAGAARAGAGAGGKLLLDAPASR